MIIIGKRPEGYIVECTAEGERHTFVVERLGSTIMCPNCGHEEPSFDLATNFVFMRHALKFGKRAAGMVSESATPVRVANDHLYHRHAASGQN